MRQTVHKAGSQGVLCKHLGQVIENCVGLTSGLVVYPTKRPKVHIGTEARYRGKNVPTGSRGARSQRDAKRSQQLLHARKAGHAIRISSCFRMGGVELATEIGAKLVNQSWVEGISVSERDNLIGKIKRYVRPKTD